MIAPVRKSSLLYRRMLAAMTAAFEEALHPRDKDGKFTDSGDHADALKEAYQFYSPNRGNLTFDQAMEQINSYRQVWLKTIGNDIDSQIDDLKPHPVDAIGDWSDGAENTVFNVIENVSNYDDVRYSAAIKGQLAEQKAVIPFMVDANGKDSLYRFTLPGDMKAVRAELDKQGIQFRTLLPGRDSQDVVVFDPGSEMLGKMKEIGDEHDITITHYPGRGEFLGSDSSQEEGATVYRQVISAYEKSHPDHHYTGPGISNPRNEKIAAGGPGSGRHKENFGYKPVLQKGDFPGQANVTWAQHPKYGIIYDSGKKWRTHVEWFDQMGLPTGGRAFDRIPRGHVSIQDDDKVIRYDPNTPDDVLRDVLKAAPRTAAYEHKGYYRGLAAGGPGSGRHPGFGTSLKESGWTAGGTNKYWNWAVSPEHGLIMDDGSKPRPHAAWFYQIGMPAFGRKFDQVPRGHAMVDNDAKTVTLTGYRGFAPEDLATKIRTEIPETKNYQWKEYDAPEGNADFRSRYMTAGGPGSGRHPKYWQNQSLAEAASCRAVRSNRPEDHMAAAAAHRRAASFAGKDVDAMREHEDAARWHEAAAKNPAAARPDSKEGYRGWPLDVVQWASADNDVIGMGKQCLAEALSNTDGLGEALVQSADLWRQEVALDAERQPVSDRIRQYWGGGQLNPADLQELASYAVQEGKLWRERQRTNLSASNALITAVRVGEPKKINIKFDDTLNKDQQGGIRQCAEVFENMIGADPSQGKVLMIGGVTGKEVGRNFSRSFYDDKTNSIHFAHTTCAKVWHELGHWLERHIPGDKAAARMYADERTQGAGEEKLRDMDRAKPGYDVDEVAKPGGFIEPYIGKHYSSGTEITSMGMQMLREDIGKLWAEDKELLEFVLGMVCLARKKDVPGGTTG